MDSGSAPGMTKMLLQTSSWRASPAKNLSVNQILHTRPEKRQPVSIPCGFFFKGDVERSMDLFLKIKKQ